MGKLKIIGLFTLSLAGCSTNPSSSRSASDFIRLQPVIESGKFAGYRAYPGKDRDRFFCLGLEPGDLIEGIAGESIKEKVAVGDMKVADGTLDAFTRASDAFAEPIRKSLMDRSIVVIQLQRKALRETVTIDKATKKKCRRYNVMPHS